MKSEILHELLMDLNRGRVPVDQVYNMIKTDAEKLERFNAEMLEAVNNLIHQVEICLYVDSDIYDLKMNKAYIDLKEKAEAMK